MRTRTILFLLLVLGLACSGSLSAQSPSFKGDFSPNEKGFPKGWSIHEWKGYKPWPTVTAETIEGKKVLHITNITGKDGGAIQTTRHFPARSGSVGHVSFLAKGKGTAWITYYRWGAKNEWNGVAVANSFVLSDLWQPHEITIPIENGHACETWSVTLAIGGKPGMELFMTDLDMDIQCSPTVGDLRLPQRWNAFTPKTSYKPKREELSRIPDRFGDAAPKTAMLNAFSFDLKKTLDGSNGPLCFFSELNTTFPCEFTLGFGCNTPIRCYLNGELALEEKRVRTDSKRVEVDDLVKTVSLKKGTNIIAIEIPNATKDTVLYIAGPVDLRNINRNLVPQSALCEETFDNPVLKCSGNPRVIRGNPTPGLLSVTGQGVFTAKEKPLDITLPTTQVPFVSGSDSKHYSTAGLRIQNFDSQDGTHSPATLNIEATADETRLTASIQSRTDSRVLNVTVRCAEKIIGSTLIPVRMLPADFLFGLSPEGNWAFSCSSLADSQTVFLSEKLDNAPRAKTAQFAFRLIPEKDKTAFMTADNLLVANATLMTRTRHVPYKMNIQRHFDPATAGWPLVFSDEFNGSTVDRSKWFFSPADQEEYAKVHDGLVEISANWDKDKTKIKSVSLYSNERFGYGYYEARVKFRQQSGWWSAFWLCTQGPSNAFLDGWEIDIYEDYYMGPKNPGEAPRCVLDHNLHVLTVGTLRSWNYNSTLPGSPDDFYTIGCKWTPFEVSYYLNGQLIGSQANHSPYDSVTFDAFCHAAGFVPLHAILSGCCGRSGGDPQKGKFPESFFVDFVRIYKYPEDQSPQIRWKVKPEPERILQRGESLHFEVEAQPNSKTKSPVSRVYLFDSSSLLDSKSEPPYTFDVDITPGYFNRTDLVKPGRSGIRPHYDRGTHAYVAFVQDESGQVSHTEPVIEYHRQTGATRPYQGKAATIPGVINLAFFDEGGDEIAYSDSTLGNGASQTFRINESVDACPDIIGGIIAGEWVKYTVQVTKAGTYSVVLRYGTPARGQIGPKLLVDGKPIGQFPVTQHQASHWGADTDSELAEHITFSEGKHEIVLLMQGNYNIQSLTFKAQ